MSGFRGELWLTEPDKLSEIGGLALDDLPQSVFSKTAFAALKARV